MTFAITSAIEGFYPQSSSGFTLTSFNGINQALPLISLIISLCASSFGMTKFFLLSPISILPKDSPINGLISLPFMCMLLINGMFGVRLISIENAFFSSYRYERVYGDERHYYSKAIDPIIDPKYRILIYFLPCFISLIINVIRLFSTGAIFKKFLRKYPQIVIACCYTPFMFEGCKENGMHSIRIWKLGTIFNAFFIGCLPQLVLFAMDYHRGVIDWSFIGIALQQEYIKENNDALFKTRYGNSLFAIISCLFFFFLISITFFTDKIFKNQGVYCKFMSIIISPCPDNCFSLKSEMTLSRSLQSDPIPKNDEIGPGIELSISDDPSKDAKEPFIQIDVYCTKKNKFFDDKSKLNQEIELKEVYIQLIRSTLNQYQR